MWQQLFSRLFGAGSSTPRVIPYGLLILLALLLFSLLGNYHEHKAEQLRWAMRRTVLLDSLQRVYEAQQQAQRLWRDSILATRYRRQAAAAAQQTQQDEKLENHYRATRVRLPAQ